MLIVSEVVGNKNAPGDPPASPQDGTDGCQAVVETGSEAWGEGVHHRLCVHVREDEAASDVDASMALRAVHRLHI